MLPVVRIPSTICQMSSLVITNPHLLMPSVSIPHLCALGITIPHLFVLRIFVPHDESVFMHGFWDNQF